jgi:hypothetical protein
MAVWYFYKIRNKPHTMQSLASGIATGFNVTNQKKQAIRVFSGPP